MTVKEMNEYLKKDFLWMDFELSHGGMNIAKLHGYIDEADSDNLVITFRDVFMISVKTNFTFEGGGDFIRIAEGDEARDVNIKYNVERGYNIYKFLNTDVGENMFIIAKDIDIFVDIV